jgi:hypothetical protein
VAARQVVSVRPAWRVSPLTALRVAAVEMLVSTRAPPQVAQAAEAALAALPQICVRGRDLGDDGGVVACARASQYRMKNHIHQEQLFVPNTCCGATSVQHLC